MHPVSHMKSFFSFLKEHFHTIIIILFHFIITDNIFSRQKGKTRRKEKFSVWNWVKNRFPAEYFPNKMENLEKFQKFFFPRVKPSERFFLEFLEKVEMFSFFSMCERERKIKFFLLGRKVFLSAGTFSHDYLIFLFFTKSCWELFFFFFNTWRKCFFFFF